MSDVTQILRAIDSGDGQAATDLLPLVYEELRKLAQHRMKAESSDHTLEPTALVHEAYIRLIGKDDPGWQNRGHFFAAAAEAMRRILIENARRKDRLKHGGGRVREELADQIPGHANDRIDLLALDEAWPH
jgi:RNA polymerase sigma factor (TIGR02999 family)